MILFEKNVIFQIKGTIKYIYPGFRHQLCVLLTNSLERLK